MKTRTLLSVVAATALAVGTPATGQVDDAQIAWPSLGSDAGPIPVRPLPVRPLPMSPLTVRSSAPGTPPRAGQEAPAHPPRDGRLVASTLVSGAGSLAGGFAGALAGVSTGDGESLEGLFLGAMTGSVLGAWLGASVFSGHPDRALFGSIAGATIALFTASALDRTGNDGAVWISYGLVHGAVASLVAGS